MIEILYLTSDPGIPPAIEKMFPFGFGIEERNDVIVDALEGIFGQNGIRTAEGPDLPTWFSIHMKFALYLDERRRWGWFRGARFRTEDDAFLAKMMFGGKSPSAGSLR
jgi:hypothetical protein